MASVHFCDPELKLHTYECKRINRSYACICEGKMHPCTGTEALYRPYGP